MKNLLILVVAIFAIIIFGHFVLVSKTDDKQKAVVNSGSDNAVLPVPGGEVLDLSGQGLTKTPSYVFDRANLVELNLSNNSLDGALQSQINQLKNLKVLNLSKNRFTGVPAEIGQLSKLEVLNLSSNQLTGLPNELGNLSNLRLLDLSGNKYSAQDLAGIRKNLPATTVIKTN